MSASQPGPTPAYLELAEKLRSRQGVETHNAVAEGLRVEYIRGQDLVAYAETHPELFERFCKGKPPGEQAREVCELLLRRGLLKRCDHLYKKPPPGKKLAKYPRKLVFVGGGSDAYAFAEESFFAWTYDRPSSPWVYVGAAVAVVGALLISLFPLAPYWVKVAVLYASAGLLVAILLLLLLRALLATVSWVTTGKAVWLLPNVLSEVPIKELLKPLVAVEASDPSHWGSRPLTRLGVGVALGGILYLLYAHAPNKGSMAREASRYRDEIFDLLNVHKEGYHRITAGNATAAGNDTAAAENGAAGEEGLGVSSNGEGEGAAAAEGADGGAAAEGAEAGEEPGVGGEEL